MPNAYSEFVKNHIHEFKHLKNTDRMRECAKLYHQMKAGKPMAKMPKKMMQKDAKGGSFLGDIIPFGHMLGLGLDTKKKAVARKPRMKKGENKVTPTMTASSHGGNFWQDFKDGTDGALGLARHLLF